MPAVGVIGSGVMGAGIAQTAAVHGCDVFLADISQEVARAARERVAGQLERLVDKGKLSASERDEVLARVHVVADAEGLADCALVVEAVAEKLDVKVGVLRAARRHLSSHALLATNTSSLSITRMGQDIGEPERLAGMHFFNPVPQMPLVEVIQGAQTAPATAERVAEFARSWGKTVVRARDTPGFIVNRVARGYYLEALRLLGEGLAPLDSIDRTMREIGGFRMGPFGLMDLVGIDVNYSVSESVWDQLGRPARLAPHPIQGDLVGRGNLGRKTNRGFYDYGTASPKPVVSVPAQSIQVPAPVTRAVEDFTRAAGKRPGLGVEAFVFARILAAVINEAFLALGEGVATRNDIDTAMRLGTSYPQGPLEWSDRIGVALCIRVLESLNAFVGDGRYETAPSLAPTRS